MNSKEILSHDYEVFYSAQMPFDIDPMSHFAIADVLLDTAGKEKRNFIHFWPTNRTVFLGMQDTKLPYFSEALNVISDYDYDYIVRNSGGLGVVGDTGVLNFSLIIPLDETAPFSINDGYDIMYDLIKFTFGDNIEAFEIKQSYCPGDYDLSINQQKFAGISQRRRAGAIAIMIYISITGNQDERSQLMRDFYTVGRKGEETKWHFPDVDPRQMTTLSAANDTQMDVAESISLITQAMAEQGASLTNGEFSQAMLSDYVKAYQAMRKRNKKMLKERFTAWEAKHARL